MAESKGQKVGSKENKVISNSNENSYSVFIYGSKQNVLDDLKRVLLDTYPKIRIAGFFNGYDYTEEYVRHQLLETDADIVIVALGTPRQELFISSFYDTLQKGCCVGVGGSLDVLSGNVRRAPDFFINNNLEWLYRIHGDKNRIKRFISNNIKFLFS